jgi:hypothetical protein
VAKVAEPCTLLVYSVEETMEKGCGRAGVTEGVEKEGEGDRVNIM